MRPQHKLHYLLSQARQRQLTGVELKDEAAGDDQLTAAQQKNFLLDHSPAPGASGPQA